MTHLPLLGLSSAKRIRWSMRRWMSSLVKSLSTLAARTAHSQRALLTLFLGVGLLILIGAGYVGLAGDLPSPDALLTRTAPDSTKIYDRNGRLLYEIVDPRAGRRTRVPLNEIPLYLRQATIAVEDSSFYENPGIDPIGIARAAWQDLRAGGIVAGGSTITQQLARDVLLSRQERESRTFTRKMREVILALRMTQTFTKDQILDLYLNNVYFGNLSYGVQAAAQTYFDKPARDLDLAESALLAGMLQSPTLYDPLVNLDDAQARQHIVLELMVKDGDITEQQAQLAEQEPLHFASPAVADTLRAPHFVNYVRDLLEARYGAEQVDHGGLNVVTTLDLNLQDQAQSIIQQQLAALQQQTRDQGAPDYNVHDAALVAIDPANGQILAMVGSANYFDKSIDGAVNVALADRQPGSSIKPITYATAFADGLTPASVFSDVPTTFMTKENQPYQPLNYDLAWHGPISLRQALATSSNMVAVKVLQYVGIPAMIDTARRLGISTFDDPSRFGLALTLGGGEVKLLDLTAAYAGFANNGQRVTPIAILSVNGKPWQTDNVPTQAVSPQVAYLVTNILSDNSARISAFGEDSVLRLDRPAAAKTGTTTDFRDNWTVGYTPDLATGVWVGNADNTPMYQITGITGAGPIWHDFMQAAEKGKPIQDFKRPPGLVDVQVCDSSGLLPTPDCPRVRDEIFIDGTQPTRYDDTYRSIAIDEATGLLWAEGCRGPRIERVYHILPPDALDWGRQQGIAQPPTLDCRGQVANVNNAPSSTTTPSAPLVLTNPLPNSTFLISGQLPLDGQRIEISAQPTSANPLSQVQLLVDGQTIATLTSLPYRALWQLAPGNHTAQAVGVDASGTRVASAPVLFQVQKGD
jgi:1A family penicillin-binding protein